MLEKPKEERKRFGPDVSVQIVFVIFVFKMYYFFDKMVVGTQKLGHTSAKRQRFCLYDVIITYIVNEMFFSPNGTSQRESHGYMT